jgi:hypothetical protein
MAGYPVYRYIGERLDSDAHGAQPPYADPHTRTSGAGSDGFMSGATADMCTRRRASVSSKAWITTRSRGTAWRL